MACVSDSNSLDQQMTSTEDKSESYSEEPLQDKQKTSQEIQHTVSWNSMQ